MDGGGFENGRWQTSAKNAPKQGPNARERTVGNYLCGQVCQSRGKKQIVRVGVLFGSRGWLG